MKVLAQIIILASLPVISCDQDMGQNYVKNSTGKKRGKFGSGDSKTGINSTEFGSGSEQFGGNGVGVGGGSTSGDDKVEYPTMRTSAPNGNIKGISDNNKSTSKQTLNFSATQMTIETTESITEGSNKKFQDAVANSVGTITYNRPSQSERPKNADFLMFAVNANESNSAATIENTYSSPIPISILTKPKAVYDSALSGKELNYTATVTATHSKSEIGNSTFTVNSNVKKISENTSANTMSIRITTTISGDSDKGRKYSQLLVSKRVVFVVKFFESKQRIISYDTFDYYHYDNTRGEKSFTYPFFLCSYKVGAKAEEKYNQESGKCL